MFPSMPGRYPAVSPGMGQVAGADVRLPPVHLDREGGQGQRAEWQQCPGGRIGHQALPVFGEPGHQGMLECLLIVVEEYAQQTLVRRQGTGRVQPAGRLGALAGSRSLEGYRRPVAGEVPARRGEVEAQRVHRREVRRLRRRDQPRIRHLVADRGGQWVEPTDPLNDVQLLSVYRLASVSVSLVAWRAPPGMDRHTPFGVEPRNVPAPVSPRVSGPPARTSTRRGPSGSMTVPRAPSACRPTPAHSSHGLFVNTCSLSQSSGSPATRLRRIGCGKCGRRISAGQLDLYGILSAFVYGPGSEGPCLRGREGAVERSDIGG